MSHVHNLFQKPAVPISKPTEASSTPVALNITKGFDVRNLLVEQAAIDPSSRIVFHTDPNSPSANRFRYLRMRLREFWAAGKLKSLLVTSPLPHDGKSTIALNLATALSEKGKRTVLLIEADLYHAPLVRLLGLKTWPGLRECLEGSANPFTSIRRVEPLGWYLLPAGEGRGNPSELLQGAAFAGVMQKVSPHFDWIVVAPPPIIPVTDTLVLKDQIDASLLVVKAGTTPQDAVEEATKLLGRQYVMGIILNGVEEREKSYSTYGYDHYHAQQQDS